MTGNARGRTFAKRQLGRICGKLAKVKTDRSLALEAAAAELGSLLGQSWLAEDEIYSSLMQASTLNGLLAFDGEVAIRARIREGIAAGRTRPAPVLPSMNFDIPNAVPNRRPPSMGDRMAACARASNWKAEHREHHAEYMKTYMRIWRARRREARNTAAT
jgi:hypothetical protein